MRTFESWDGALPVRGERLEFVPYGPDSRPVGPLQLWEVVAPVTRHLDVRPGPDGYGRHVVVLVRAVPAARRAVARGQVL